MPEQYTITGMIIRANTTDGTSARVQAFDRNLPSLERFPDALPLLGEAITNSEGLFSISYTPEQFRAGRNEDQPGTRPAKKNADISFRVYDQSGQELAIHSIDALNRSFGAGEIIFNAPAALTVNIFLEPGPKQGGSEYEILLSMITPAVGTVPLTELTDKDMLFLLQGADIQLPTEQVHRIQWLRRSAILGRDTGLPTEVFYGWGRMDNSEFHRNLSATPLSALPSVLEILLSEPNDQLLSKLEAAVQAKIIPDRKDHFKATINQIERLKISKGHLVVRQFSSKLISEKTGLPLAGLVVQCFDLEPSKEPRSLGLRISNKQGSVTFNYLAIAKKDTDPEKRKLRMLIQVSHGNLKKFETAILAAPDEVIEVQVPAVADVTTVSEPGTAFAEARIQAATRAQTDFLNNLQFSAAADEANRLENPLRNTARTECGCRDCDSAVSPLAYLADLLQFTRAKVKLNDAPLTLDDLTNTFRQPFNMPVDCTAVDTPIKQVRICAEVLRRATGISPQAEKDYLLATYTLLLTKIGTSFSEVRLVRNSPLPIRQALADRLGIKVNHLEELFLDPDADPAVLTEARLEQLFGVADTTRESLTPVTPPVFQTWRLEWLHAIWQSDDLSITKYDSIPSIDPDLIGPDDFRRPFFPGGHGGFDIFILWKKRRLWVDDRLQQFAAMTDIAAMFNAMYQPVTYGNTSVVAWLSTTPVTTFETIYKELGKGINSDAIKARLLKDLGLTRDSFIRLMSIANKDNTHEKVQEEEWQEVHSILVQVQKMRLTQAWREEEEDEELIERNFWAPLSAQFFWHPLREPEVGVWPPVIQPGRALIDPETLKLSELPEAFAGAQTIPLWKVREAKLAEILKELALAHKQQGFNELLKRALGHHNPGDDLEHDLTTLKVTLASTDPDIVAAATKKITRDLHLSIEQFRRLLALESDPDAGDWPALYAALTTARKIKHEYTGWIAEEQDPERDINYWNIWKAKLPRWRASREDREYWRTSLQAAQEPPVLEPDLLGPDDFKNWDPAINPAFNRWKHNKDSVDRTLAWIKGKPSTLAGLDLNLQSVIGITVPDLLAIATDQETGKDISGRLIQLLLDFKAFNYLLRVCRLATDEQPILPAEWDNVHSILLQAMKRRRYFWMQEKLSDNLFLNPGFLRIAPPLSGQFQAKEPSVVETWRAPKLAYLGWQNKLQSRIDQEQSVMQALQEAVSATEEATLPILRDALIDQLAVPGEPAVKASWVTDNLLIDARMSGGSVTTRVAQAIETLQSFLFKIRTGQLNQMPNTPGSATGNLFLLMDANQFDEEWKWIGAYASWRSAMFAFLYPENLLQPGLRREEWQTPAFKTLLNNTRSNRKWTPGAIKTEADRYARYFQDIGYLDVRASCVHLHQMFLFGISEDRVYWSVFDLRYSTGYAQTIWTPLSGNGRMINEWHHIVGIVGAAIYRVGNTNWLFLFAKRSIDNVDSLLFIKYDIATSEWTYDAKILALDLPVNLPGRSGLIQAVLKQQDQGEQPHLAIQVRDAGDVALYFERRLNPEGTDWDTGGFRQFGTNTRFQDLLGMTADPEGFVYIFKGDANTMSFDIYSYHPHSDNTRLLPKESHSPISFSYGGSFSLPGSIYMYMVGDSNAISTVHRYSLVDTSSGLMEMEVPFGFGLTRIVPVSVSGPLSPGAPRTVVYWMYDMTANRIITMLASTFESEENPGTLFVPETNFLVKPAIFEGGYGIPLQLNRDGAARKAMIQGQFENNAAGLAVNQIYLQEAYYFVPMHLALTLQKSGEFVAALDLYRTVYDYTEEESARKIYYGLVTEESLEQTFEHAPDWLLDPLNPHMIAFTRRNAYTRFTLFSIIRCLVEFADAEFTQDTAESNNRARQLYLKALQLFDAKELQQSSDECIDALQPLDDLPVHDDQGTVVIRRLKQDLQAIDHLPELQQKVQEVKQVLLADLPFEERLMMAGAIIKQVKEADTSTTPRLSTILENTAIANRALAQANEPLLAKAMHAINSFANEDFQRTSTVTANDTRPGTGRTVSLASRIQGGYLPRLMDRMCVPVNPVIKTLRTRAEMNLTKLRTSRNIAGLKRQVEPYAAAINITGLPTVSTAGQLQLPGIAKHPPTLYRYQTLIERVKQLIQLTAQMEAGFLSAIEKRDSVAYAQAFSLLKARQELGLAQAGIQLQSVRLTEAIDGVSLSTLQQVRAQIQVSHYQRLLAEGKSKLEEESLKLLREAADALAESASLQKTATTASGIMSVLSGAVKGASAGGPWGAVLGGFLGAVDAVGPSIGGASSVMGINSNRKSIHSSISATLASYERRAQEWEINQLIAIQDIAIGTQQITLSKDRVEIVQQEKDIAQLQASNARDTIEFLNTQKFTNADLYDWMSNLLESVYRFFLQQTTAMARIAESQLAFERQEIPPAFIQTDYWTVTTDGTTSVDPQTSAADRRGLTGSARLLQDIYRLDDYAFNTNKRKLQLSKTLSLVLLVPAEFQRFRETGVLLFSSPMELFDRDFPGHYLRLIHRVRVSVIALIPPVQGIHATLTTSGLSRVVIGPDIFQMVPILREPELVALTASANATGLFELDPPSTDLLFPFEGSGVDTTWEFQLPKPSNQFDYRAIADVLITIEYTALNSFDYRRQVVKELNPALSSDRPFSFRNQFPDQWYDLHNPDQSGTPMIVRFETFREDFPINLSDLMIQHVLLYFVRNGEQSFEIPVSHFRYTAKGEAGPVGGGATTIDGVISTRRGNAGSWTTMIGKSPEGLWELALPDTEEIRKLFSNDDGSEGIGDILFVISYGGRTLEWPV